MGYAAEKAKVNQVRRKVICIVALVVVAIVTGLCIFSSFYPVGTWKYYFHRPKIGDRKDGELRMHFIDVGQGDCTLIELPDGKTMLVDGGNDDGSTQKSIMRYLNALKIDTIDYMLVTHADADHCGSLTTVLKYKQVDRVFLPYTSPNVNVHFSKFYKQLRKEDCVISYSSRLTTLSVSVDTPYVLQFLHPYEDAVDLESLYEKTDKNDYCGVFWLDYYGVSAIFMADAPQSVENKLMADDALKVFEKFGVTLKDTEILKVGHHGSADSTSEKWINYLNTQTAIISCGEDNAYEHPAPSVCHALTTAQVDTYRTDTKGSIIVTVKKDGTYTVETLGKA